MARVLLPQIFAIRLVLLMEPPVSARINRDERRTRILEIAHEAFLTDGYAATSMSTIAARLGGSKATLYNYFSSKEKLFCAVIANKCERLATLLYDAQVEGHDFRSALQNFGERFVRLVLQDESIATYRLVTAETERFPKLGRTLYDTMLKHGQERIKDYFCQIIETGQLLDIDSGLMARYFFDLCLSGVHMRRLWNADVDLTHEDIRVNVTRAVAIFLAAFSADKSDPDEAARLCGKRPVRTTRRSYG